MSLILVVFIFIIQASSKWKQVKEPCESIRFVDVINCLCRGIYWLFDR